MRKCLWAGVAVAIVGCSALQSSAQETIAAPSGTTIQRTTYQNPTPRTGVLRRFGDRRDRDVVTTVTPATTTKVETTPVTPPTTTAATTQVSQPRSGLIARLRGRLGR